MAIIGSLNVLLQASTAGLTKGLDKGKDSIKEFASSWGMSWQSVGLAAAAAAAAAGAAFVALSAQALDNAGRLDDMAQNLGSTTDNLHALEYAAHMSGVTAGDLEGALNKLNVQLAEAAATGSGPTAAALDKLGLSAKKLSGMDITDAFKEISTALAGVEHEGTRASLGMDIMGKASLKMLQFLGRGGEGIKEFEERARRLNIVLEQADADNLNAMQDSLDDIGFIVQGLGAKLAADLAPALSKLVSLFTEGETTGKSMANTVAGLADVTIALGAVVIGVGDAFWDSFTLARSALYDFVKFGVDSFAWLAKGANLLSNSLGQGNIVDPEEINNMKLFAEESANIAREAANVANQNNLGVKLWNELSNSANDAAVAERRLRKEIEAQTEALKKAQEAKDGKVSSMRDELALQYETLGLSEMQRKIYLLDKAAAEGADAQLVREAQVMAEKIEAHEEDIRLQEEEMKLLEEKTKAQKEASEKLLDQIKKEEEERLKAADAVRDSVKTDKEKQAEEVGKLEAMLRNGDIDEETFNRAIKSQFAGKGEQGPQFAGVALEGSAEARSSIMRNQAAAANPQNKIADNTAKLVLQGASTFDVLKQMANGFGQLVAAPAF